VRLEEGGRAGVGGLGVGDAVVEMVAGVEGQSRLEAPEQVGTEDDIALAGA
jgi:hypothetical protein